MTYFSILPSRVASKSLLDRSHHEAKIFTEPYLLVIVDAIRKGKQNAGAIVITGCFWVILGVSILSDTVLAMQPD